ncbi:MAG: ABC transporter ATP-binding protein [Candidatus Margulisbacteria bacterium]|jgi:putative ABC transport system ATP-binding protein|nr:ABC transporter ATP-binding protein [Candidatus Margulisiibacteriota bacterium]
MALVKMENAVKNYKVGKVEVPALRGITLSIEKGDFAAIAGPSGSGKTTMLNLFGCLDKPTGGKVYIEEHDIITLKPDQLADVRNQHIGFIFQSFNLIPVLTAFENVEFPLILLKKHGPGTRRKKVLEMLAAVGIADLANRLPGEMSGGQQQRVAIARALVKQPDYVLADEPTANIDTKTGHEILELMRSMNEKLGTTFIFSTHDPKVMEMARRLITVRDGLVESDVRR